MSNTESNLYAHSATIMSVADMQRSLDFYAQKLGFHIEFTWREPVEYAVLREGDVSIHLSLADPGTAIGKSMLYIFVHDIQAVYQRCKEQAVSFKHDMAEREYGMTDFDIYDPDGHQITFGKGAG